jgi:hypothetical protein
MIIPFLGIANPTKLPIPVRVPPIPEVQIPIILMKKISLIKMQVIHLARIEFQGINMTLE